MKQVFSHFIFFEEEEKLVIRGGVRQEAISGTLRRPFRVASVANISLNLHRIKGSGSEDSTKQANALGQILIIPCFTVKRHPLKESRELSEQRIIKNCKTENDAKPFWGVITK